MGLPMTTILGLLMKAVASMMKQLTSGLVVRSESLRWWLRWLLVLLSFLLMMSVPSEDY